MKRNHAVNINKQNCTRHKIPKNRLHPGADLQAPAGVGFGHKIVPAPAKAVAAEQRQHQRPQRQHIVADDEVPEVQPRAARRKRLEVQHAVAQRRRQRQQKDADAADHAALRAAPPGQLTHHGKDILADAQHGGQRRKHHEQKEKVQIQAHNRVKQYILKEGVPVPFLIDLGVMNEQGKIIHARYDKFRQINRFLEFIEDILPRLSRDREITILDFGCGKSYLTFAMYYYLRELKGYDVNIIGLDLKTDVIEKCNSLAIRYGYEKLHFYHGDIADYEGVSCVDMVVTLHACDTATDYALAKAVEWGAEVILSVPCCQHEVNKQIKNEMLEPVLRYGILKERMSALITDAVRADLLESKGYDTQILEFIDMEHTPKNLLIRAVRTGKRSDQGKVEKMLAALNIHPTLDRLLNEKEQEGSVR